jgi:cytoskeletal protein RodZ
VSNPHQYPQQPQPPQQPGWGHPQPPQAWQPPPPKKSNAGKIVGFGCLGLVGLLVLLGIVGALIGNDDSSTDSKGSAVTASSPAVETPAKEEPQKAAEEPSKKAPEPAVKVVAKKTKFAGSILADGSNYTSVLITVTNNSDKKIDVNPLYFAITGTDGTKRTAELAVDENQIDTVDLAPGENISGTVTGKGKFTPKYVTYTDGFFGDSIRADVN